MKSNFLGILALIGTLGMGVYAYFNKPPRIGYVETSALMTNFTESIKAKAKFEQSQKEWDHNLKTLNDSLTACMEMLKIKYDNASKEEKINLQNQLKKRNDDLQRYTNAVKKMAEEKEGELMGPVIQKMNGFLDMWGKKNGYDIIFGTMTGGNILQANSKLNLTLLISKELNAYYRDLPTGAISDSTSKKSGKIDSGKGAH